MRRSAAQRGAARRATRARARSAHLIAVAMTHVVEKVRRVPWDTRMRAGLSVGDVFFSHVSAIGELLPALSATAGARRDARMHFLCVWAAQAAYICKQALCVT